MYSIETHDFITISTKNNKLYIFDDIFKSLDFINGEMRVDMYEEDVLLEEGDTVAFADIHYGVIEAFEEYNTQDNGVGKYKLELEIWNDNWSDHSHDVEYLDLKNLYTLLNKSIVGFDYDSGYYLLYNKNTRIIGISESLI